MLGFNQMQRTTQKANRVNDDEQTKIIIAEEIKASSSPSSMIVKEKRNDDDEISAIIKNYIFTYMETHYMVHINANPKRAIRLDVISSLDEEEHHKFNVQVLMKEHKYDTLYKETYIEIPSIDSSRISSSSSSSVLLEYLKTPHTEDTAAAVPPPEPLLLINSALTVIIQYWQPIIQIFINEIFWSHNISPVTFEQSSPTTNTATTGEFQYTAVVNSTQAGYTQRKVRIVSTTKELVVVGTSTTTTSFTVQTDKDEIPKIFTSSELKSLIQHVTKHYKARYSLNARYNAECQRITMMMMMIKQQ